MQFSITSKWFTKFSFLSSRQSLLLNCWLLEGMGHNHMISHTYFHQNIIWLHPLFLAFTLIYTRQLLHDTSKPNHSHLYTVYYINYSNTTKNNILFIDISASRRKPSSWLTSGAGRQYVKACPIRGSSGSSPRLDSCCWSSWSILPPLWVCHLCLILDQSPWRSSSLSHDSHCKHDLWLQILAALVFSALVNIPVILSTSLRCSFTLAQWRGKARGGL